MVDGSGKRCCYVPFLLLHGVVLDQIDSFDCVIVVVAYTAHDEDGVVKACDSMLLAWSEAD
jgi:hypothetical protein